MSQLNNVGIDLSRYNKFPQLDNLKNVLRFMGVKMDPDMFGCRTIGTFDKTYEVIMNNCRVEISIPDLRFMLILHSHYLRYQNEVNSTINLDRFYDMILKETDTFDGMPTDYIQTLLEKFTQLLPILQQIKQYE
jgi:hypothetical protein